MCADTCSPGNSPKPEDAHSCTCGCGARGPGAGEYVILAFLIVLSAAIAVAVFGKKVRTEFEKLRQDVPVSAPANPAKP